MSGGARLAGRRSVLAALLGGACTLSFAQHEIKDWKRPGARPALKGVDLDGRAWDLAELQGRAVLVNFWVTWCAPCKQEMPMLQTLHELADPQRVLLAVNVREPLPRVRRYVQSTGLTLPVLTDPRGELAAAWGIGIYPSTLLVDAGGTVRQIVTGAVDWTGPEASGWLRALQARR